MECSSGLFKVSTILVKMESTGLLVFEQSRLAAFLLLHDAAFKGSGSAGTQVANSVEVEIRQPEGTTIAVDQGYHPVTDSDGKDGALIGQVLVPTSG